MKKVIKFPKQKRKLKPNVFILTDYVEHLLIAAGIDYHKDVKDGKNSNKNK